MARTATGIDVGARTSIAIRGKVKGTNFAVSDFAIGRHTGGVEAGWSALEPGFKLGRSRVGVSGRHVNVRYTRVPRVPDWQLRKLMRFEVAEIGGQSEASVASDFNVLPEIPEIEGEDVVLLAMARETLLEEHLDGLTGLGAKFESFMPSSIALYNAWLRFGVLMEDTVLVADIGHENLNVVLVRGTDLLFARNLTGGSGLFDDALAGAFGCSAQKAEELKTTRGTLMPAADADTTTEKISRALMGPAGQLLSLFQSTVAFCKSQVKLSSLKLDRVMICGGGAALPGLDRYLANGLGVPVERFDPFTIVDTSGLAPERASELERHGLEAVCALGLATAASDPDAYSVEIVPDRVQRRRELWGGKAFLVGAGLLGLAYIGYDAWQTKADLTRVEASARQLKSRLDSARRAHAATEEILAESTELDGLARELYAMAGTGEQAVRALRAIHEALPEALWITHFTCERTANPDLGVERGAELPILSVTGKARQGTESVSELFRAFVDRVRTELPHARLNDSLNSSLTGFALELTLMAEPQAGESPTESSTGEAES